MRGSRPGERRGGRQKGTPNKKTALDRAAIAALADNKNLEPLDLMLAIMRDPQVALATRAKMALTALPRLHTKPKADQLRSSAAASSGAAAQRVDRPNESEGGNGKSAAATSREAKLGASKNGAAARSSDRLAESDSGSPKNAAAFNGEGTAKAKNNGAAPMADQRTKSISGTGKSAASATAGEAAADGAGKNQDLMPLDFLLSVMRHPKTPAALRIKVALATQPYIHPRKSNRPSKPVAAAADRHGFEVEPALAKKLRNEIARLGQLKRRRNPRPADQKTVQKLHLKIDAKIATLQCPCPSGYSVEDAARDEQTLVRLWRKRRSRAKLTAAEDAALAHINARYAAYAQGPEARARARLAALQEKGRLFRAGCGRRLSVYERAELRCLVTLYPRELPEIDEDLRALDSAFSEVEVSPVLYGVVHQPVPTH
jgi:hypothetical protein